MSANDFSTINASGYESPNRLSLSGYQAVSQAAAAAQEAAAKPAAKSAPAQEPVSRQNENISLEFKVDPEKQDVTVLILDKSTRKVIRTIPPEELSKLREGDLVELFR